MAGVQKRDRAVNSLVADAEKAFARGDPEAGGRLIGEAANLLVERGEIEEAINLCVGQRDYGRAAAIAEQASKALEATAEAAAAAQKAVDEWRAKNATPEPLPAAPVAPVETAPLAAPAK